MINPSSEWIPAFFVTEGYLTTCNPASGGYFVQFSDRVSYIDASTYDALF